MPSGLQCWNEAGTMTLDLTHDLLKFLGTISIGNSHTGSAASGTATDARLTAYPGCEPFWCVLGATFPDIYAANVTFVGNVLTWSFPRAGADAFTRPNTAILYGLD